MGESRVRNLAELPRKITRGDDIFITLSDGVRIAATIWLPVDADADPVPAVLEAVPYRRRDGTIFRDTELHPYVAAHGFAMVRVDIRGAGDSEGVLSDEYLPLEQRDCAEVIAWLAAQSWCNGKVGMTGISWGGFNALQVAALRPPALKAIVTLCSTDDRYADDVHYMGGCLLTEDPLWSGCMLTYNALPPDPQIVGDRWRAMWQERLAANRSFSESWLKHQRRDAYWKQGSVCEDFSRIEIPVYAIGGWDDSYPSVVLRLLAGLKGPRKGIIGAWNHFYPCRGGPGPLIGYLQEMVRWWSHWLKDEPTSIMDEPMLTAWINHDDAPRPFYDTHPGRWVAEAIWPSPNVEMRRLHLNDRALGEKPQPGTRLHVRSPLDAGAECGRWGGYGGDCPDMAPDQRREDGMALCFDTPPLESDLEILGIAKLDLNFSVDVARANLCARLCDVAPDGTSSLIAYGVLNLTHRESHEFPSLLVPGKAAEASLTFKATGRRLPRGHRLRLALSTQHWPVIWPQPWLSELALESGLSALFLPVRKLTADSLETPFGLPETAPSVESQSLRNGQHTRVITEDVGSGRRDITLFTDYGRARLTESNIITDMVGTDRFTITKGDPLSAIASADWSYGVTSGDADVAAVARTELRCDAENLILNWRVETRERGKLVHEVGNTLQISRDFI